MQNTWKMDWLGGWGKEGEEGWKGKIFGTLFYFALVKQFIMCYKYMVLKIIFCFLSFQNVNFSVFPLE